MNDPLHSVRDVEDDERFRAAVDLSPDAILMHMRGRITYVNDAAVRLLGASGCKVLLGRPVEIRSYTREKLQRQLGAGNAVLRRILAGPKQWIIGDEQRLGTVAA